MKKLVEALWVVLAIIIGLVDDAVLWIRETTETVVETYKALKKNF